MHPADVISGIFLAKAKKPPLITSADTGGKMKIFLIISMCTLLIVQARADGPRLGANGRYIDGAVAVIKLTKEQKKFLKKKHQSAVESAMKLTASQSKQILDELGIETGLLEVWDTRKKDADCSCLSANIALRFSDDAIEVLKPYLLTDKQALEKWEGVDSID